MMLDEIIRKQQQLARSLGGSVEIIVREGIAASKTAPTKPVPGSKRFGLDVTAPMRAEITALAEHYTLSYRRLIYTALDIGLRTLRKGAL